MQTNEDVSDLTAGRKPGSTFGAFQHFWRQITKVDIFADVGKDEKLMQMHSAAEQYDPAAERLFIPLQVTWPARLILSV